MKKFFENAKQALLVSLFMLVLCGLIYPLAVTGVAQALFNHEANGSLINVDGEIVGSEKLGQAFTVPEFFWGRVSAVNYNVYSKEDIVPDAKGETVYNGVGSGTFNYAPSNPELQKRIEKDIESFLKANPGVQREQIPADLVTASGSGLDPHISVESALIQIARVAQASGLSENEVKEVVKTNTVSRELAVFGEDKVHVLEANLDIFKKMTEK
ncbi:K(+)-transporting ATPase subunit C [Viridibacillus sp. YIM B01967]|uniref:Potassium-transporting ATPase KdpC subunit n=1 Tax=Viridibacillus soli TaxID=2798301 RepID=A0ABS1HD61_9BACL|nr:K(+)-transporting ATPase subunit C [Viridibacillus soli]MBK3497271.1 K(+)-transporting ATPase subunit C [Viridibacillus soli]